MLSGILKFAGRLYITILGLAKKKNPLNFKLTTGSSF
jgi:hypothetical protein